MTPVLAHPSGNMGVGVSIPHPTGKHICTNPECKQDFNNYTKGKNGEKKCPWCLKVQ